MNCMLQLVVLFSVTTSAATNTRISSTATIATATATASASTTSTTSTTTGVVDDVESLSYCLVFGL